MHRSNHPPAARLKGENQLPKVVQGVRFQNGIEVIEMSAHHAA
jgi:putative transposase